VACRSFAVFRKARCGMHGGAPGSGAPRGNRNALNRDRATREARADRAAPAGLLADID